MKRLTSVLAATLILAFACGASPAATYYVAPSPTGNDANVGSSGSPWATLQHAVDTMVPGDTTIVLNGTYTGFRRTETGTGTSGSPITIMAQNVGGVFLNAVPSTAKHNAILELEGGWDTPTIDMSYWVLDGFVVDGGDAVRAIDTRVTSHCTIQNCVGRNANGGAVSDGIFAAFCDAALVQNNTCYNNAEHGIYVNNSADDGVCSGNTLYANTGLGIHMNGDISQGGAGTIPGDGIMSNWVIAKNVSFANTNGYDADGVETTIWRNDLAYGNSSKGLQMTGGTGSDGGGVTSRNNKIYNNTFICPATGFYPLNMTPPNGPVPPPVGNKVFNNILYTYATGPIRGSMDVPSSGFPGFESDYNVVMGNFGVDDNAVMHTFAEWQALGYDVHSTYVLQGADTLLFVNPGGHDYHLKTGSAAIDAGTTLAEVTDDLDGNSRPQGVAYDCGCYEFGSLTIESTSLKSGDISIPYSRTIDISGGATPYVVSIQSGSLPAGLALDASTGVISGTPTVTGTSQFTAEVTDAATHTATRALSIAIHPLPAITTSSLPDDTIFIDYDQTLAATGGTTPYTWSISFGSLPQGLGLDAATGEITGAPTAAGMRDFTVLLADDAGATATADLSIMVHPWLAVWPRELPQGTFHRAYDEALTSTDGTPPVAWSIFSGNLPEGLSLDSTDGVISGTPTATGTSDFAAAVTDSLGAVATRAYSIVINPWPSIMTTSLPPDTVGIPYSRTLAANGGTMPYAWSISAGDLPAGLSLDGATGAITGTPTDSGTATFTVMLTDNAGATATQPLSIVTNLPVTVLTDFLPPGMVTKDYNVELFATGGTGALTWSLSGTLPPGLSLDAAAGVIAGTPTTTGTYGFTVTAADTVGSTDTKALSIPVIPQLVITTARLHHAALNVPYDEPLYALPNITPFILSAAPHGALDGGSPYSWSVASGTLPPGLSLEEEGVITGTPTASGTSSFTAQASSLRPKPQLAAPSFGFALNIWTATKPLSLIVTPAPAEWLTIDKFNVGLPAGQGHDSFVLQGSFNTWPDVYAPETVTLSLDNWQIRMRDLSWRQVGNSNVYRWSQTRKVKNITYLITGEITYWVNGTSKCQFTFTGVNLTLKPSLTHIRDGNVNVTLEEGLDVDKTIRARGMTVRNHVAAMTAPAPPALWIESLGVIRNLNESHHDSLALSALVYLDSSFNPAHDDLTMNIAGHRVRLPAGTAGPAVNGVVTYTKATLFGKMTFRFNNTTHALTVSATGIDMSSIKRAAKVSLAITNHAGAVWDYALFMAKNKAGTAYSY